MSAPTIEAPVVAIDSDVADAAPQSMHALLHAMPVDARFRHALYRADTRQRELELNRDKLLVAATRATDAEKRAKFLRAASIMQRRANHHAQRANHLANCLDAIHQGFTDVTLRGRTTASRRLSD